MTTSTEERGYDIVGRLDVSAVIPAPRPVPEAELTTVVTDVYQTTPGTAASLEASEEIQGLLAERWALGHPHAFITV